MAATQDGREMIKVRYLYHVDRLSGENISGIVAVLLPGDRHVGTEVVTPTILRMDFCFKSLLHVTLKCI